MSKEKLLNTDFSYNFMSFKSVKEPIMQYDLVGTKSEEGEKTRHCIDTFKDEKGKYLNIIRETMMEKQKSKSILPVIETKIIANTQVKKSNKRAV